MSFRCEWCDKEFESGKGKCDDIVLKMTTGHEICGGPLREIQPCEFCGCLEYQCKCEPERYEDRQSFVEQILDLTL